MLIMIIGLERLKQQLDDAEKSGKKGPPIYEPGSYPTHLIAALAAGHNLLKPL